MLLQRQRKASERRYERLFCAGRVQDAIGEVIGGFYSYAASRKLLQLGELANVGVPLLKVANHAEPRVRVFECGRREIGSRGKNVRARRFIVVVCSKMSWLQVAEGRLFCLTAGNIEKLEVWGIGASSDTKLGLGTRNGPVRSYRFRH